MVCNFFKFLLRGIHMGFWGALGSALGSGAKALAEKGREMKEDQERTYGNSSRMSDDELKDRIRDSSLSLGERSGYMKRYKENHPEKYGDNNY